MRISSKNYCEYLKNRHVVVLKGFHTQRVFFFEFCIELFWKTLKKICIAEQFHPTSPKQVLQSAFEMELIQDNYIWQAMINDKILWRMSINEV